MDTASPSDPFELSRFVAAQDPIYEDVLGELKNGFKRSHWMWFVFPQMSGLGTSRTSERYAIGSLAEARSYLGHPILGPRLLECTKAVNGLRGRTALDIFGAPDNLKFCSSMTLFELVTGPGSEFSSALDTFYRGKRDPATLRLVQELGGGNAQDRA